MPGEAIFIGMFFGVCALFTLLCFVYPEKLVHWSAKYFKWYLETWMGFECQIKVTPRAVKICRNWNLLAFFSFVIIGFVAVTSILRS